MTHSPFRTGLESLLAGGSLRGLRVGLVSHIAALTTRGATSAEALFSARGVRLAALFAPEHGFFGAAGAGDPVRTRRHPLWGIPVHSLYGRQLAPSPAQFRRLDLLVVDLQDLAVRCYTYVSTLRHALEAAAAAGVPVVVADRPVPLPSTPDGPLLEPGFESFVGCLRAPFCYAMTPGETALWLKEDLGLRLDLRVAKLHGWRREPFRSSGWPPWVPPSPGIRSWESAAAYPATVFTEGVASVSCGRTTTLPFQLLGAPWFRPAPLLERLEAEKLPGVRFFPHPFIPPSDPHAGRLLPGIRLVVEDPARFRPARTAAALLAALQALHGRRRLWEHPGSRPDFLDKLFGTDTVRRALLAGAPGAEIAAGWEPGLAAFARARRAVLLYPPR